jgi:sugar phosphate permease
MSPTPAPDSRRSWLLLGVLVAGYIGVYLCRKNFAVAVPLLQEEFHASKEEVGRIASAGTLAYALGKMLLCPLADRFGGQRCFLAALGTVALFGGAAAFAPSLGALAVVYSFNRFGGAAAWASMVKQIPPWFGPRNLALALAVLSLSYVFGGAAAVALAGQVSEWSGHRWRAVMAVPSLVLVLLLGLAAWMLPRDRRTPAPAEDGGSRGFSWKLVRELLRVRGFWVVAALSFTLTLVRETFNDWTVDYIKTTGGAQLSAGVAAFLSTPFDLCGAAGIIVTGVMVGRLGARGRTWLLTGHLLALAAVLGVLPTLTPFGLSAIVPAVGLVGFLALGPYSLLGGYFAVQLRGPECAGTVSGIVDSVGYFAGILAGSTFGWLLDRGGYGLGFNVLAAVSLVSAGLAVFLDSKPSAPTSP